MRHRTHAIAIMLIAAASLPATARAQEAKTFEIGGYGELLFQRYGYGPAGTSANRIVDIPRFVLEFEYFFGQGVYTEAEIEWEHGGTGVGLVPDGGTLEPEIEKGGEIALEQFYIAKRFSPALSARVGHFIVPIGLLNVGHHPNQFFTAVRGESETALIPTTWHETGAEVSGNASGIAYRLGVVNGLNSAGFSTDEWVEPGVDKPIEETAANDLALFTRLDYVAIPGLKFGASTYYGNSTHNRPQRDMEDIDGHVGVTDVHGEVIRGPFTARAMFLYGTLENADSISAHNGEPIGSTAMAWYGEAGYDVLSFLKPGTSVKLYPFVRYEYYNAMQDVDPGITKDPSLERNVFTGGLNLFLTPNVVLKADWAHRTFADDAIDAQDTISIAAGFSGNLFRHDGASSGGYGGYETQDEDDDDD